ncbi:MAG: methyltransferase domain-containing protein [Candidatus Daviesbacteria bacterium]|nr:MAG: methyltransferase domain-containing protein [Candidatus Daviesbacteria bacterium]
MEITLIIVVGILFGCLIGLSWFAGSDAPFVPTKTNRIKKILKLIPLKNKVFYELGSGDGRVVIEAAKMGAQAFGIEQSFLRILYSKFIASRLQLSNTHFIHGNIFKQNLSAAQVVFIFLLPKGVEKLESKLKKELKKGSLVITQTFHFKNWKPLKKILITDKKEPNTFLGPNKKEGEFYLYQL